MGRSYLERVNALLNRARTYPREGDVGPRQSHPSRGDLGGNSHSRADAARVTRERSAGLRAGAARNYRVVAL